MCLKLKAIAMVCHGAGTCKINFDAYVSDLPIVDQMNNKLIRISNISPTSTHAQLVLGCQVRMF